MRETALGAALKKAGVVDDSDRLRKIATDIYKKAGWTPLAVTRLCKELTKDRALLEAIAEDYLKRLPGEGQYPLDNHPSGAQSRQGEEGQFFGDAHKMTAPSPSPIHDGGDQIRRAIHPLSVSSVVNPEAAAARGKAAKVIANLTKLDTYRLSNGQIVGDLYWSSLHRINRNTTFDACLTKLLLNHGVVMDPNAKVRDVVTPQEFERMLQKAKEMADGL